MATVDRRVFLAGMAVIFLILNMCAVSAATCSKDGYVKSCDECQFVNGRMDRDCMKKYKDESVMCVGTNHLSIVGGAIWELPSAIKSGDFSKFLDGCPAAKRCVKGLEYCASNEVACPGDDFEDCHSERCLACYSAADACIARADKDCESKASCGDGNCDVNEGETPKTCCKDCGCPTGYSCVDNKCEGVEAGETTTTTMEPTTTTMSEREAAWNLYEFCDFGFHLMLPLAALLAALAKFPSL